MENKLIPPFYVGQEVVVLKQIKLLTKTIKRGSVVKITAIYRGECGCSYWNVSIGIKETGPGTPMECGRCSAVIFRKEETIHPAQYFAPITSQFQSIEYREVLEKERELVSAN
jgi:hypothetical protein